VIDYNVYFNGALSSVVDGGHSVSKDPLLVAAATGDLHLAAGSPAIDKGDAAVGANAGALDIDGDPRVKGTIDIGADER
jgi:serralysin